MGIRNFLYSFDLFGKNIGLHYKGDSTYHTLTSSIFSIIIFLLLLSLMINQFVLTINKSQIKAMTQKQEYQDPTLLRAITNDFMFAVGVQGLDLNQQIKFLNITLQNKIKTKQNSKTQIIKLVKCQKQNWEHKNFNLSQSFDRIGFNNWLCPQLNQIVQLQGKYTSEQFKYLKLSFKKCSQNNLQNITCPDQAKFNKYFNQSISRNFQFYFVNTILNPDQNHYRYWYLQDKNYLPYNIKFGVTANLFIDQYDIQTDQSITPTKSIKKQKGWTVPQTAKLIYRIPDNQLFNLYIRKSSRNIKVKRQFLKIDQTISFIGGLFTFVIVGLYIFNIYTDYSFQTEICSYLFTHSQQENWNTNNQLNFFQFLSLLFYKFLKFIRCKISWQKMQIYNKRMEQIRNQMDIVLIIRKILFLQKAIQFLFTNQQLFGLHLQDDMNIQQAQKNRKRYKFFKNIKDYFKFNYQEQDYQVDQEQKLDFNFMNKFKSKIKITKKKSIKNHEKPKQQIVITQQQKVKKLNIYLKGISNQIFKNQIKLFNEKKYTKKKNIQRITQLYSQRQLYEAQYIDNKNMKNHSKFQNQFDQFIMNNHISAGLNNRLILLNDKQNQISKRIWNQLNTEIKLIFSYGQSNKNIKQNNNCNEDQKIDFNSLKQLIQNQNGIKQKKILILNKKKNLQNNQSLTIQNKQKPKLINKFKLNIGQNNIINQSIEYHYQSNQKFHSNQLLQQKK